MTSLKLFTLCALYICIVCLFVAYPVMLLWNWLMPVIFNLIEITFWQALGLTFLSHLLFGKTGTQPKSREKWEW